MKKTYFNFHWMLTLALCFGFAFGLSAQSTFSVSGTVTDLSSGNPVPNHAVYITSDSLSGLNYSNIVFTNSSGQYSDVISVSVSGNVNFMVGTFNCQNVWTTQTLSNQQGTVTSGVANFSICAPGGGSSCNANFSMQINGSSVSFTNTSSQGNFSYSWNFGDGSTSNQFSPTHTYTSTGVYTVCLTISDSNCTDTYCDSLYVSVGSPCNAYFGYAVNGQNVQFNNTSTGGSTYVWDFGDGTTSNAWNPSHFYSSPGNYTVCLSIFNGQTNCSDSICWPITITSGGGGNCQASFTTSGSGNSFNFTNTSQGGAFYSWNFGDGTTSNQFSPSHTYNSSGWFTVCLTISDTLCTSTYCDTIYVAPGGGNCQANFSFQASGQSVQFINSSTGGNSYFWDFGDGSISSAFNPNHFYSTAGTYIVCLTVFDSLTQCQDSICLPVTVQGSGGNCNANFSFQVSGQSVQFINSSTGGNYYSWSFGDGGSSNQFNPSHFYSSPGTYTVCLSIWDTNSNCQDSICLPLTIQGSGGNCSASFIATGNGGNFFQFSNTSTQGNFFYSWSFGDGSTSNQFSPSHTYSSPGFYQVCLTISDSNCTDTYCDSVYVPQGGGNCLADFNYQQVQGQSVQFFNISQGGNFYTWSFGDGGTSNQYNPAHTYASPGTYTVCLTILDTVTNCQDSICYSVMVQAGTNCQASFVANFNGGTSFSFTNTSQGGAFYSWDFGDGGTSNAMNPNYTYSSGGGYLVCLTISDSGCTSTYCDSIFVPGGNNCLASFTSQVNGSIVDFTNTSTGGNSYFWSFGDGNSSSASNPQHTYAAPGTYTVCLIVFDSLTQCQDSICNQVTVGPSTSIGEVNGIELLTNLYPNPVQDRATIEIKAREARAASLQVLNTLGQPVRVERININPGVNQVDLELSGLASGMYILNIVTEDQQYQHAATFIKK